MYTSAHKKI